MVSTRSRVARVTHLGSHEYTTLSEPNHCPSPFTSQLIPFDRFYASLWSLNLLVDQNQFRKENLISFEICYYSQKIMYTTLICGNIVLCSSKIRFHRFSDLSLDKFDYFIDKHKTDVKTINQRIIQLQCNDISTVGSLVSVWLRMDLRVIWVIYENVELFQ